MNKLSYNVLMVKTFKLVPITFLFFFAFVPLAYSQWSGVGPGGGGGMHNSAISPVDSSIMGVSCDMGGYYVTSDSGTSWKMINQYGMPTQTAFDPTNKNIFYCCADLVYRTTDKGATWSAFTDSADHGGNYPLALIVDPEDTNFIFMINGTKVVQESNAITNAVYSANGGTSWNSISGLSAGDFVKNVFIDKDGSSATRNIYVATDGGFYKSTNGAAFVAANTGLPSTYIYDFDGGYSGGTTSLYVTLDTGDMYKSTNGAASWSVCTSIGASALDVKVPINYPNTVYTIGDDSIIYKSINGGAGWSPMMDGNGSGSNVTNDWQKTTTSFGFGWATPIYNRYHCISVCGSNANVVLWTDDGRLVRSDNGGTTWTGRFSTDKGSNYWSTTGLDATTTYKIVFDTNNPSTMYLSETDIGLWKSINSGTSWTYLDTGYHNTYGMAIDPANSNKLWVGYGSVHDLPETKVLGTAPSGSGGIRYSTNGGTSWSEATGLPTISSLSGGIMTDIVIDPTSASGNRTLYATTFGRGVYKSVDDGHSWSAVNTGISGSMNGWKIERGPDGSLYTVFMRNSGASNGVLYKSTNGGTSWTAIKTAAQAPDYILDVAVNPTDSNIVYVCGYTYNTSGGVYKTINGGGSWTRVLSVGYTYGLTLDAREPNTVYAGMCWDEDFPAATETNFYKTTNAGTSWLRISTITFRACREVFLDPTNINKMYVTTFGGGLLTNVSVDPTYSISGYVKDTSSNAVSGVTVNLSGASNNSTSSDVNGFYQFSGLNAGSYMVTPAKTDWNFSPLNKSYASLVADQTNQDYFGTFFGVAPTYKISGYVKDTSSAPMSGVNIALTGSANSASATDSSGYYEFSGLSTGTYTVTPSKTGWNISPVNKVCTVTSSDFANQDFFASVSGGIGGNFLWKFTVSGRPYDVDADTNGFIYTGTSNKRIYKYDSTGTAVNSWTTSISTSYGISVDANFVYTAETSRAVKYTSTGTLVTSYQGNAQNAVNVGLGITIDASNVYVVNNGNSRILKLTLAMASSSRWNVGTGPMGIDCYGNYTYAADTNGSRIVKNTNTGGAGATFNLGSKPVDVALDSYGRMYVLTYSTQVIVLDAAGVVLTTFGGLGSGDGQFNSPRGIGIDSSNRVYVADTGNNRIQVFDSWAVPSVYIISGYVKDLSGNPISGADLILSGDSAGSYTTSSDGYYEFTNVAGTYTVTVSHSLYVFSTSTRTYSPLASNQSNQDFSGTPTETYAIDGYVKDNSSSAISGVTVTLSGTSNSAASTNAGGYYSFVYLSTGAYTVTPSKTDWSFNPMNRIYSSFISSQTNQDFFGTYIGSAPVYSISGYVQTSTGAFISGAKLILSGSTSSEYTTGTDGFYIFSSLSSGNYIITPTKTDYTFEPSTRAYSSLSSGQSNQNFVSVSSVAAVTYIINGYVLDHSSNPLSNSMMTLVPSVGLSTSVYTDGNGFYLFASVSSGTCNVIPSKTDWIFSPSLKSYTNLNSSQTSQNFFGVYSGTAAYYTISGYVLDDSSAGISGVIVSLSSGAASDYTTAGNGFYTFTYLSSGSYIVTPSKQNYLFNPSSMVYAVLITSQAKQNYFGADLSVSTTTPPTQTYSISGHLRKTDGTALSGVTVTLSGDTLESIVTDSNGYFSFTEIISTGAYALTPSKTGWAFSPSQKTYDPLGSDKLNQDFAALFTLGNSFGMKNNLINPLKNEKVEIDYSFETPGTALMHIYAMNGALITKLLDNASVTAGPNVIYWNGKDGKEKAVASGIYFVLIKKDDYKSVKKVCVIK